MASPRSMEEREIKLIGLDVYWNRIIATARNMYPDEMEEVLEDVHRIMDERGEDVGR